MSIIEVRNLSYTYPKVKDFSLRDINININKGELILLTGPSGCGKTTLCRCMNGLIPHFYNGKLEGEVQVCNLSVKNHKVSELAQHVGFVFQNPDNQLFALSVEKDIAFGLENLGFSREIIQKNIDWAIELMDIQNIKNSTPFELSGGQKQRVAIATVLAMKPKIIILDEPTAFLDPFAAWKLFEIIDELNKKLRLTIILVEHRLNLLSTYAKRIIIMDKGKVKIDGSPIDVFTSEITTSIGIGIPKILQLCRNLIENGINIKSPTLQVKRLAKDIRSLVK